MREDAAVIRHLYDALRDRDGQAMADCYTPDAHFHDPVFPELSGREVGAMWRMLCERAQDLHVKLRDVEAVQGFGAATWEAEYVFAKTGRKVRNVGQARFAFHDGRIVQHADNWSFHAWAGQAMGASGKALGWSKPFQDKVRRGARKSLDRWMAMHP